MLRRELFETYYSIHNHNQTNALDPTPHVSYMVKLDPQLVYQEEIKRLIRADVPEKLNMGLDAILRLPTHTYNLYVTGALDIAREIAEHNAGLEDPTKIGKHLRKKLKKKKR